MCPTKFKILSAACIQSIDNLKSERKLRYRFKYKIKSGIKCLYNILRHFILGTSTEAKKQALAERLFFVYGLVTAKKAYSLSF